MTVTQCRLSRFVPPTTKLTPRAREQVWQVWHKSWGSRPAATSFPPSMFPPSILLSTLPSSPVDSPGGLVRARSPAAKHFDAIYTVKQPYRPKSTLMFNVLPSTEISVHAIQPLSAELILWITGHV